MSVIGELTTWFKNLFKTEKLVVQQEVAKVEAEVVAEVQKVEQAVIADVMPVIDAVAEKVKKPRKSSKKTA